MITHYKHTNIKGTSANISLGHVNLITGPNRSSKTAKMEGLSLAATGKAHDKGTAAKLAGLISRGESYASAEFTCADQSSGAWHIRQTEKDGKVANSATHKSSGPQDCDQLFGDFIRIEDFWSLTNEQKWQVIGALVRGESEAIAASVEPIFAELGVHVDKKVDVLTNVTNLQAKCKQLISEQTAKRNLAVGSLTPPEEYKGRPLGELHSDRIRLEKFIEEQKTLSKNKRTRDVNVAVRAKNIADYEATLAKHKPVLAQDDAKIEAVTAALPQLRLLCNNVRYHFSDLNEAQIACQENPIGPYVAEQFNKMASSLLQMKTLCQDHMPSDALHHFFESQANLLRVRIAELTADEYKHLETATLKPPSTVEQIRELLATLPINWKGEKCKPSELASADTFVSHELEVIASSRSKTASYIASVEASLAKLKAEQDAEAPEPVPQDQFIAAVTELDAINKQILRANEWPAFIERQKEATAKCEEIDSRIRLLQKHESTLRATRANLLKAASAPVEGKANELITATGLGLEPLELRITSTEKQSSLSIQTTSGIDVSTMCGCEKVIYGSALLFAIHSLSSATSPLALVECAELDGQMLSGFLTGLTKVVTRGNVVLASHVCPAEVPAGVNIIDCGVAV